LAIYKRGRGIELGTTVKQIQVVVRANSNPGLLLRYNRNFVLRSTVKT